MQITNDDGTPLSPADLLELGDLLQHPGLTGLNDRPAMPCPTAAQLQALLAEPTPSDQQDFWSEHAMGTALLASFTSPADDD
jgi:hypothetical protein